jgi:hypothetical protein
MKSDPLVLLLIVGCVVGAVGLVVAWPWIWGKCRKLPATNWRRK